MVFLKLIKSNKKEKCIYNFDLIAKIPTELKGKSKGVKVEDWFNEVNDEYNILNQIDIDFGYCKEEDLQPVGGRNVWGRGEVTLTHRVEWGNKKAVSCISTLYILCIYSVFPLKERAVL